MYIYIYIYGFLYYSTVVKTNVLLTFHRNNTPYSLVLIVISVRAESYARIKRNWFSHYRRNENIKYIFEKPTERTFSSLTRASVTHYTRLNVRRRSVFAVEFRSKVACENEVVNLQCNPNSRLAMFSASYGRTEYESIQCPQPQGVPEESNVFLVTL